MIPPGQLLEALARSLREVIGPAVTEPYPKSQAYMAAVLLDFVARQSEERSDLAVGKQAALEALSIGFPERWPASPPPPDPPTESWLCELIEWSYGEREELGPAAFGAANAMIRDTLRTLLDEDLKVAGGDA